MEKIIKTAKEIGFESKFLYNKPYKYSSREELRSLFWLIEFKQYIWLKYSVYLSSNLRYDGTFEYNVQFHHKILEGFNYNSTYSYLTEYDAIKSGIEYILENLKNIEYILENLKN